MTSFFELIRCKCSPINDSDRQLLFTDWILILIISHFIKFTTHSLASTQALRDSCTTCVVASKWKVHSEGWHGHWARRPPTIPRTWAALDVETMHHRSEDRQHQPLEEFPRWAVLPRDVATATSWRKVGAENTQAFNSVQVVVRVLKSAPSEKGTKQSTFFTHGAPSASTP